MYTKPIKKTFTVLLVLLSTVVCGIAVAAELTVDNFTHIQTVTDRGNSLGATTNTVTGLTGTDLSNVSRSFSASATAGGFSSKQEIRSGDYALKISNSPTSSGFASVTWTFDPIDFTAYGNAMLLEVESIDLSVSVEMIANGIASSGIKTFHNVDDFLVSFNEFSNGAVFSNLSSFQLNFTGPLAWDGQFKLLTTTTSVPVPSAFLLMGSVLLGFAGVSRKKQ